MHEDMGGKGTTMWIKKKTSLREVDWTLFWSFINSYLHEVSAAIQYSKNEQEHINNHVL